MQAKATSRWIVVNSNDSAADGCESPARASASKPSTSILMKAGWPWRAINISSVVIGTRKRLVQAWPSQPGARVAAAMKSPDPVETVGVSILILISREPCRRPDCNNARAEPPERGDAVTYMGADVKNEFAGMHELRVMPVHGRPVLP